MKHLDEIQARRARLIAAAARERRALAQGAQAASVAFAVADRGIAAGRWLRAHPYVLLIGPVAMAVFRPRPLLQWGMRALATWRTWRSVAGVAAAVLQRMRAP